MRPEVATEAKALIYQPYYSAQWLTNSSKKVFKILVNIATKILLIASDR
jgi:hypothetical protein